MKKINLFELYASIAIDTSDYERSIKDATKSSGKAKDAIKKIAQQSEATKNKVKVLAEQYKSAKKNVSELTKAFNQQVKKTGAASQEAQVLAKKLDAAQNEADQLEKELKSYSKTAKKAGDNSKSFGEKLKTGFSNFGKLIAGIGVAAGTVVGVIASLDSATEDYRKAMGKLKTAYDAANMSTKAAKKAYTEFYKILGDTDTATEAAQLLSKLTQNEQDITKWTRIAAGVYGTFGDSLPIEALIESINETARAGQITGNLADALNWASLEGETFGVTLKSNTKKNKEWNEAVKKAETAEDYFNLALQACTSEAERNQLIMDTLAKTYDSASDAFYENNQELIQQRETQAKLDESLAKIGESVSGLKTKFLTELEPAISTASEKISEFIDNFDLQKVKEDISNTISTIQQLTPLLATVGGLVGVIATGIGTYNAVMAVKDMMDKAQVTTLGALIAAQWAQAAATIAAVAPYIAIAAAIAALIAIIVLCVKHWDKIKAAGAAAWEWIKGAWESAATWFSTNIIMPILFFFASLWTSIKDGASKAWEWIKNAFSNITSVGRNIVEGIWNGISNGTQWIKDKISGWVGNVTDFLKGLFGIASPSKLMRDEVGKFLAEGIGVGFELQMPKELETMKRAVNVDGLVTTMNSATPTLAFAASGGYGMKISTGGSSYDAMLDRVIGVIRSMDWKITLDDGTLVGRVDSELGKRETYERRGN